MLAWLQTPDGIAVLGVVAWVLASVVGAVLPAASPVGIWLRRALTDVRNTNLVSLPPNVAARIELAPSGGFDVVLSVAGRDLHRQHVGVVTPSTSPEAVAAREAAAALRELNAPGPKGGAS